MHRLPSIWKNTDILKNLAINFLTQIQKIVLFLFSKSTVALRIYTFLFLLWKAILNAFLPSSLNLLASCCDVICFIFIFRIDRYRSRWEKGKIFRFVSLALFSLDMCQCLIHFSRITLLQEVKFDKRSYHMHCTSFSSYLLVMYLI